jgi:hypothetical protein
VARSTWTEALTLVGSKEGTAHMPLARPRATWCWCRTPLPGLRGRGSRAASTTSCRSGGRTALPDLDAIPRTWRAGPSCISTTRTIDRGGGGSVLRQGGRVAAARHHVRRTPVHRAPLRRLQAAILL